jgi:hypothetical protein
MIFQKFPQLYHPVAGFIAKLMSYITSITWAYRDLFIINNSIAFSMSFREINKALFASLGEIVMLPSFYEKYRNIYAKLRIMLDEFDEAINTIILLAITNNVFVICSHLFSNLR